MTSIWRKKENFTVKSTPNQKSKECFSNMPMFDILKNIPDIKDENKDKENKTLIEGFEWQGIDYYHHHTAFKFDFDYSKIKEVVEKLMGYLSYPITNFDSILENFIYDILMSFFLIQIENCNKKEEVSNKNFYKNIADEMFFWIDTKNYLEEFSLKEQPNLINTINSFKQNHPDFITNGDIVNKVGKFYAKKLNNYQTKLHRTIHDDELFEFNNEFDNLLNDVNTQKQILKSNVYDDSFQSPFQNTESDYKKYYDSLARFKIDNTDNIDYYVFNYNYFSIPYANDNTATDNNKILLFDKAKDMRINLTTTELDRFYKEHYKNGEGSLFNATNIPPSNETNNDLHYAFSVDMGYYAEDNTIQEYLKYVIKYFSLCIFEKIYSSSNKEWKKIGFQEIESRVGTIYTNCLNRLDFLHYNTFGNYLDTINIAIFNHIFYILIQQDNIIGNKYNEITNKYIKISDNSSRDNKILAKNIFERFIIGNNSRYSIIQTVENIEIPIVALNPFVDLTQPNESYYLQDYILDNKFKKSEEMEKYYIKLSDCELNQKKEIINTNKNFKKFAKIIKNEIYRILMIPVFLYVVYNIYYMFFFIDYTLDDKKNEVPVLNQCKIPIFPDWENYFHYYEKHKTDFLFEFVFKPTKIIYTWLNTIKMFIRTFPYIGIMNSIIPPYIIPPYIYFFITVILFYYILSTYGNSFINFYVSFLKTLSVPFVKILKVDTSITNLFNIKGNWLGYTEISLIVTFIFFILSFLKDNIGEKADLLKIIANLLNISSKTEEEEKEKEQEPWFNWISSTTSIIFIIFKIIVWIIYWLLKSFISYMMIPISAIIAVIYLPYTLFFAIYNNTKDYSSKKDFINNIIYTQLYDIPQEKNNRFTLPIYVFKSICWFIMVFIMEIISIYILCTGLKNITNNITNSGDSSHAEMIKLFLIPIYILFMVLIVLWCLYKYKFKIPVMEMSYIDRSNIDEFIRKYDTKIKDFINMSDENKKIKKQKDKEYEKYFLKKNGTEILNKEILYNEIKQYNKFLKIKEVVDKRVKTNGCTNINPDALKYIKDFDTQSILRSIFCGDYINKEIINEEMKKLHETNKDYNKMNNLFNSLAKKGEEYTKKIDEQITSLSDKTKITNIKNIEIMNNETIKDSINKIKTEGNKIVSDIGEQANDIKNSLYLKYHNLMKI